MTCRIPSCQISMETTTVYPIIKENTFYLIFGAEVVDTVESLPEMEILSDMWKEKVTFIGINIDDEKSWKEFSQRKNIKWIDLNDPKGAFGLYIRYKANGTPFYVLVTPDGKITDIWYGYNKDSLSERLKQGIK